MMKDNALKLRKAYESYVLNDNYNLVEQLLEYIEKRVLANKNEIEELINTKKENIQYSDIEKAIKEEIDEDIVYKNYKDMEINKEKFISASLLMPIGIIAVEAFDTIKVIKYFIKAIKSRNAIAISDVEYDEHSVKFLILEIIKQALIKFNIDENIIMILPYEECFYKYFDKVIYTYDKYGKELHENKYEIQEKSDKKYIFIESKELEEIAIKDNNLEEKEFLYGNIEDAIAKINENYTLAASIYTKEPKNAYKFISLVHSRNILVNSSLKNAQEIEETLDEMYEYKNIIIPMPKDINIEEKNEELSLAKVNMNAFEKIKKFLKRVLFRN